ncbi:Long-chain-alcohol O-fatty-acyltransferase [Bertholletia excelsa]
MEREIRNFILVWISALSSLCYCHAMAKFVPKGNARLCFILPVVCLFFYLPLNLTSIHLGSTTAFFITWLGSFKLLLFSFGRGPLSSSPPLSLPHFILFSCLPIKAQLQNPEKNSQTKQNPDHKSAQNGHRSPLNYPTKITLLGIIMQAYKYKNYVHPKVTLVLYCLHIYISLELFLVLVAALARAMARLELEPQFNDPYLATSLQDFWGRRWNLMVTSILRPTIYDPTRAMSAPLIGGRWAPIPAVFMTFLVSGVMHELIFYYAGRLRPTWEVTCFFLLHGLCLVAEIGVKRMAKGRFRLPAAVSGPLVMAFVMATALWLFLPPAMRFDAAGKAKRETAAIVGLVKAIARVSRFGYLNVVSR